MHPYTKISCILDKIESIVKDSGHTVSIDSEYAILLVYNIRRLREENVALTKRLEDKRRNK